MYIIGLIGKWMFVISCFTKCLYSYVVVSLPTGGSNFVFMADPSCMENILRAEGKHPRREATLSSKVDWLLSEMGYPPSIAFQ